MSIVSIQIPSLWRDGDFVLLDLVQSLREIGPSLSEFRNFEFFVLAQEYPENDLEELRGLASELPIKFEIKDVPSRVSHPSGITPFMELRYRVQEACDAVHAQYVMMMDDDFRLKYESFVKYQQAVDYMDLHDDCGSLEFAGYLGGYTWRDAIRSRSWGLFQTNYGLMFRLVKGKFIPRYLTKYLGYTEEQLLVSMRIASGLFHARSMNFPGFARGVFPSASDEKPISYDYAKLIKMENTCIHALSLLYDDPNYSHEDTKNYESKALTRTYEQACRARGRVPVTQDDHDLRQPDSISDISMNKRIIEHYRRNGESTERFEKAQEALNNED